MPTEIQTSQSSNRISLLAPAKVNLFLHITGQRDDGFHELESLFVRTDFGDQVTVEDAEIISLKIIGPFSAALGGSLNETNLVVKAANCLLKHHGKTAGAKITLEKNLPVASGLGGGSADAAATLLALVALWHVRISNDALLSMALKLGSDVPACLENHPQWVRGIGELCQTVKLGYDAVILLVNPCVHVSTPEVFKAYSIATKPFSPMVVEKGNILSSIEALESLSRNDLYEAALSLSPVIKEVIDILCDLPNQQMVRMSGSGATCFAIFNSLLEAEKASKLLTIQKPKWWVASCKVMR